MTTPLVRYWAYPTKPFRTTEEDLLGLSLSVAGAAYVALRDLLANPGRIGTKIVAEPVRCFSTASGRVWLYYAVDELPAVLGLLLVREFRTVGRQPSPYDDADALNRWFSQ